MTRTPTQTPAGTASMGWAAAIWAALCGLTIVSVMVVEEGWWRWSAPMLVAVIAALKARLVIVHYMEAGRARRLWRVLYAAWIFAAAATIILGYLMGAR